MGVRAHFAWFNNLRLLVKHNDQNKTF